MCRSHTVVKIAVHVTAFYLAVANTSSVAVGCHQLALYLLTARPAVRQKKTRRHCTARLQQGVLCRAVEQVAVQMYQLTKNHCSCIMELNRNSHHWWLHHAQIVRFGFFLPAGVLASSALYGLCDNVWPAMASEQCRGTKLLSNISCNMISSVAAAQTERLV